MNETTVDQNEEDLLISEIPDDALESVVFGDGNVAAGFTLYFCTGLDICPGP